jgi:UDP-glucose 4-epimerase
MVVPRFVRLALAGEPIPVYGDGTQRRSFTGDVVGAMLALIGHPKAYGEDFNIGHTRDLDLRAGGAGEADDRERVGDRAHAI